MTEKPARGGIDGNARTGWSLAFSRLILTWERFEVAAWPLVAYLLFLAAIALTGVVPSLPFWAHIVFLAGAFGGGVLLAVWGMRQYARPSEVEARRRLEAVNALEHHPLETLQDKPSQDDPMAVALWEAHRERTLARLGKLSVGGPAPKLAKVDPFALRIGAAFLFILALVGAGDRAGENLAEALVPSGEARTPPLTVAIDAWLAPPDYTALPPVFIARAETGASPEAPLKGNDHAVPVGSRLVVQVTGVEAETILLTPNGPLAMESFAANGVAVEHEVRQSGAITVEIDGQPVKVWDLLAIEDTVPEIEVSETPTTSLRQALSIPHIVMDDYGIVSMRAEFERADRTSGTARSGAYDVEEDKIITPLPVPDRSQFGETRRVFRDYTAHPWAGGLVRMTLYATDAIGQEGRSEPVEVILPARVFNHPVAQAIVDARRELAWDPIRNHRSVSDTLQALAWNHQAYGDDVTVFMSLREAQRRLAPDRGEDAPAAASVALVVDMLWKTALYLEDGGVSLALERLRAAEQALMDAIADGAEMDEIERLMDELQQAMNEYLDAMSEQMAQQMQDGDAPQLPQMDENMNMLSNEDMDRMLEQMREMMRNGDSESAMQMLEQMRQMMENLQAGVSSQMSEEGREAMELLEGMQDIMESQRELMDRTHRRSQEMQQGQRGQQGQQGEQGQQGQQGQQSQRNREGGQGSGEGEGQAQLGEGMRPEGGGLSDSDAILQDALRRQLGEIMRQFGEMMGEIPEPFGRADEGMSESTQSLNAGDPAEALGPQGEAMDALQDAAQSARNAFLEQFQSPMSMGNQMPGQTGQQSTDPFGRDPSENVRGPLQGEVTVPDEGGIERSRAIRDELRRRSGDRSRPQQELDYIDRLLDPFQ